MSYNYNTIFRNWNIYLFILMYQYFPFLIVDQGTWLRSLCCCGWWNRQNHCQLWHNRGCYWSCWWCLRSPWRPHCPNMPHIHWELLATNHHLLGRTPTCTQSCLWIPHSLWSNTQICQETINFNFWNKNFERFSIFTKSWKIKCYFYSKACSICYIVE